MIEVVYEKEKQKPKGNEGYFRIPNNIRQIGDVGEGDKIYIEDYAYTYLSRISEMNLSKGIAAVLLGQVNWRDGTTYLFIKSAVMIKNMDVGEEHLAFSEEIWNQIYEQCREYFPGQDIIGWFLSIPGCTGELHEVICKTHNNHFGGRDKVLFFVEPTEKEESFYRLEQGSMKRQKGYYIYYEKNDAMREYLVLENNNESIEKDLVEDKAVKNFRKIIENRQEEKRKQTGGLMYAMVSGMLIVLLVAGVVMINDYETMQEVGEAAQTEMVQLQEHYVPDATPEQEQQEYVTLTEEVGPSGVIEEDVQQENEVENTSAPAVQSHVVQKGDTITSICRLYYGSIAKIGEVCRYNNLTEEEIIYPGQIILLP